jgi:hypothetical protein
VQAWLSAVAAAGLRPHVAFEHARGTNCPDAPCSAPRRTAYGRAVRAFVARFPQVRTYTTWNEANHGSQPVTFRPEAVAGYYEELGAACPRCTVVAGDVLDSGSYIDWIRRFRAATASSPRLWGGTTTPTSRTAGRGGPTRCSRPCPGRCGSRRRAAS